MKHGIFFPISAKDDKIKLESIPPDNSNPIGTSETSLLFTDLSKILIKSLETSSLSKTLDALFERLYHLDKIISSLLTEI